MEKVFFKHYAESKQVIQSFWSKLWGTIIHKIFRSKPNTENESEMSKKIVLDYEFEGDVEKVEVSSADKFSLKLTQTFTAKSTSGSYGKKYYRQKAMDHLARYTMFDMSMAKLISDAKIKGPMTMVTNVLIEKSALIYFHGLAENQVKRELRQVCKEEKNCIAELEKRYKEYITKWHQTGVADLNLFKKFISEFYKRIRNNADFFLLFGVDNVFINGSIDAVTSKNQPYQNFFKSGQFRGLGVIDDFMRTGNQVVLPIETN